MEDLVRNTHFWRDRRVLVTGATGIVGSWLIRSLLASDARVVALIRDADPQSELFRSGLIREVSVVNGALEDFCTVERALNEYEVDTVFHLGAQTIVGTARRFPLATFEANIRGTYNLLEAVRLHADIVQRIVIASSDKAYGEQAHLPYLEKMPLAGRHPYDVSKTCADLLAQSYYHTFNLPIALTRCGNIYGGGDLNWSRIVPGTIRSLLQGESPIIRSDGKFVRDYIYVKDVTCALMRLAERLENPRVRGQAFNLSTESPVNVLQIVRVIQEIMDCEEIELRILNRAEGEIRNQHLSAEKARNILGWNPGFKMTEALTETVSWYRDFLGR